MSVVPEIDPTVVNSELYKRVMGTEGYVDHRPRNRLRRLRMWAVVVVMVGLGVMGMIWWWRPGSGQEVVEAIVERTGVSEKVEQLTQQAPESAFSSLLPVDTKRTATSAVLRQSMYAVFRGEISSGSSGVISEGAVVDSPDKNLLANNRNTIEVGAEYVVEVRGVDGTILARVPVWFEDDGNTVRYQGTGPFTGMMLLPSGTNSVVLRETTGEVLDQIYMEEWTLSISTNPIKPVVESTGSLIVEGEVQAEGTAVLIDLVMLNVDSYATVPIGVATAASDGIFRKVITLKDYDLGPTGDWQVIASARSFFQVARVTSNRFRVAKK